MDEPAATNQKIEAYPIEIRHEQLSSDEAHSNPSDNVKMLIKCKSCAKLFDSTFTAEEFASLPKDQNESGTLHLCPHCGQLSIYLLKDYVEIRKADL
ncbi:MAG: hypothetical protein ACRECH_11430 [Nitrososphaerales archaeon]